MDYGEILRAAEKEADVILWDGGNNDLPFYKPDLHIVVADPHRPGHELAYYPGETNLRMADVVVINKVDTADARGHRGIEATASVRSTPRASSWRQFADHRDRAGAHRGKRVLVVEDGPTLTHGEMATARAWPRPSGTVPPRWSTRGRSARITVEVFDKYPGIGTLLPAVGTATSR